MLGTYLHTSGINCMLTVYFKFKKKSCFFLIMVPEKMLFRDHIITGKQSCSFVLSVYGIITLVTCESFNYDRKFPPPHYLFIEMCSDDSSVNKRGKFRLHLK